MVVNIITYLGLGIISCIIAAIPFGLVNLSVADARVKYGKLEADKIALGAVLVELIFAIIAYFLGEKIINNALSDVKLRYFIVGILIVTGMLFFFKKNKEVKHKITRNKGFLRGIFLNLISLQVLTFWFIAFSVIISNKLIHKDSSYIVFFLIAVVITKYLVLKLYSSFGALIIEKSDVISSNINKIIGFILFLSAGLQFLH